MNLKTATMPEAIAAMVEAWLDAQETALREQEEAALRHQANAALVDELLIRLNGDLGTEGCSLRLERRGGRLGLRGPMPRRDGKPGSPVQRISLGVDATESGLHVAMALLDQARSELAEKRFNWDNWPQRSGSLKLTPASFDGSDGGNPDAIADCTAMDGYHERQANAARGLLFGDCTAITSHTPPHQ